jgi:hypothetical protein
MPDCYHTTRRLPFLTDFSARDRELVEKAAKQQEERQRRADGLRRKKADGIREDLRRQLRDLLGANKLAELRQAIRRERLAFRDLWQPPAGLSRDYAKEKKAGNRKIDALVRKLGANPEKLRKLCTEFDKRLLTVLSAPDGKVAHGYHLPGNLDKWMKLTPLHQYPLPWGVDPKPKDPRDPHRWFLFRTPFFWPLFSFWYSGSDNFRCDRELFLDPTAGLVGNKVWLDCDDGDLDDLAQARAEAQIAVVFEPPIAGIMEICVDVQSLQGRYDLEIRDDFGFSRAMAVQNNFIMMSLLSPYASETQLALMDHSETYVNGDDSSTHNNHLNTVQHYFAHFFSSEPVRAGESIYVTVGTRSMEIASAHNMDLHSQSDYRWFISSVEVHIVP